MHPSKQHTRKLIGAAVAGILAGAAAGPAMASEPSVVLTAEENTEAPPSGEAAPTGDNTTNNGKTTKKKTPSGEAACNADAKSTDTSGNKDKTKTKTKTDGSASCGADSCS